MDIAKADIVISTAGHDKGDLFFVLEREEQFVLIADGKRRKLENPKRKKLKHVRKVTRIDTACAEAIRSGKAVLNSELRKDLAACSREIMSHNQGG